MLSNMQQDSEMDPSWAGQDYGAVPVYSKSLCFLVTVCIVLCPMTANARPFAPIWGGLRVGKVDRWAAVQIEICAHILPVDILTDV